MNEDKVRNIIRELIIEMGEDPEREGLLKTPDRVMKSLKFLTQVDESLQHFLEGDFLVWPIDSSKHGFVASVQRGDNQIGIG